MNSKSILCAIVAASMLCSPLAIAKGDSGHKKNGRDDHGQRDDRHDKRGHAYGHYKNDERRHGEKRGAGPDHSYYRGDRLPLQYRSHRYVVSDWHSHRLSAPPRGYHWVQSGGDYILVAIATGIILQLLLSN